MKTVVVSIILWSQVQVLVGPLIISIPPTESNPLLTKKHLVCKEPISLNAMIYMGLMGETADYRKLFHDRMMKRPAKPYSIWWVGRDWLPHNFAAQS